jgi:hypothetical protein
VAETCTPLAYFAGDIEAATRQRLTTPKGYHLVSFSAFVAESHTAAAGGTLTIQAIAYLRRNPPSGRIARFDLIPGVGYKPRKIKTVRDWFTNEMYIGWWQPDEDQPDVLIDHHDPILDYALFAEGYTRLTGYTLEGESVENHVGTTRARKDRETPPDALFHGRLLATPPSPDRRPRAKNGWELSVRRLPDHGGTNGEGQC